MIQFTIPGDPVPFARAGANGKRRFTPKKQSDFMGVIKHFAAEAMDGKPPIEGPVELQIDAFYVVPQSWSKKKTAEARWKSSKPDADNIAKILKDAIKSIVWIDDAQVARLIVSKQYGPTARMNVWVSPLT